MATTNVVEEANPVEITSTILRLENFESEMMSQLSALCQWTELFSDLTIRVRKVNNKYFLSFCTSEYVSVLQNWT